MVDFDKLDRTIHEKGRLAIMTVLAARKAWSFQDLKVELKMSDGNLITHLRTLREAGYVSAERDTSARPRTDFALTARGRAAFTRYLGTLEAIVKAGRR